MTQVEKIILAARNATSGAPCISPRIAYLILKLFAPVIVHSEEEFLYKHAMVKLDGVGSFFVSHNNGFSSRFPASRGVKNGWICYLFSGEIECKSAGTSIKIKSSDRFPMYYLANTINAEIKHNNAHILFVPVGAAHVDFVEARARLSEAECRSGIGIFEIIKISNISGGKEFIVKEILGAQCISSKMDVDTRIPQVACRFSCSGVDVTYISQVVTGLAGHVSWITQRVRARSRQIGSISTAACGWNFAARSSVPTVDFC
jgi:hypothetical protein